MYDVWRFCDGWNPQALPLALAFYQVQDVVFMTEQLLLLRDTIARHNDAAAG